MTAPTSTDTITTTTTTEDTTTVDTTTPTEGNIQLPVY